MFRTSMCSVNVLHMSYLALLCVIYYHIMVQVEADIGHVKRQIDASVIRKEALKVEYMTYTRTLQETEQSLAKATTVS